MNLDRVTVEIRPRSPWEAVDLGLLMARRWWWPLTRIWLLLTFPLFMLLNLLPGDWRWLSLLVIWWLKPLFERPLLHLLSHAVFGELPDTRSALRAFPGLAWRQWFASLTWRRLSLTRSMDLPVLQLEGMGGYERSERLSLLHRSGTAPASWLTILGVHLEGLAALGVAVVLFALLPGDWELYFWEYMFAASDGWAAFLSNLISYFCMALVAPFYVACGFSLYLNRRIQLEAWDIDIAFRRIVGKRQPGSAVSVLAVFVLGLCLLGPVTNQAWAESSAQQASTQPYDRDSAKRWIEEVMTGEDFQEVIHFRYLRFKSNEEDEPEDSADRSFLDVWWELLMSISSRMGGLASFLQWLLWALVLGLVVVLILRYRHWLAAYLPQRVTLPNVQRPVTLFGMEVTRESLPEDISAAAETFWQQGEHRQALALLYRASLSRLLESGLEIEEGYTEGECLQLVRAAADTQPRLPQKYFARLTRAWQRLAYGHSPPDAELGQALCRDWNPVWQAATKEVTPRG